MAGAGYKLFSAGDVLSATDVNTYMMQQTVMVFANASARTTALSSVLAEGMVSYLQDTNSLEVYDGSAWVGATGDITGLTAGTGVAITSPSGPVPTVAIDTAVVPRLGVANTFTGGVQQITAASDLTKGLIVRGFSGTQSANLFEAQDSGGNNLAAITNQGAIKVGPNISGLIAINNNISVSAIPLNVRGMSGQTGDLTQWQNSGGTVLSFISSGGNIRTTVAAVFGSSSYGAMVNTTPLSAATVGIVIRGAVSQTADLQQWQNSAGGLLARIDSAGNINLAGNGILSANGVALRNSSAGGSSVFLDSGTGGATAGSFIFRTSSSFTTVLTITGAGRFNFIAGNTATTATAGAITPPSQVTGYITAEVAGTTVKIPYYSN